MVGGFVQQQQVGFFQQGHGQGHAAAFPAGKLADGGIVRGKHHGVGDDVHEAVGFPAFAGVDFVLKDAQFFQQLVHDFVGLGFGELLGDFVEAVHHIEGRLDGRHQVFADGLVQVDMGFLGDVADFHFGGQAGFAVEVLVDAGHDAQQGAFAGAVFADDADFGPVIERQRDIA